jgi:hypothetical protein
MDAAIDAAAVPLPAPCKEALAARDIAGMDDDVRPPPALAPDALRPVNWTGCKRSNT